MPVLASSRDEAIMLNKIAYYAIPQFSRVSPIMLWMILIMLNNAFATSCSRARFHF